MDPAQAKNRTDVFPRRFCYKSEDKMGETQTAIDRRGWISLANLLVRSGIKPYSALIFIEYLWRAGNDLSHKVSPSLIMKTLGVSRATLYRSIEELASAGLIWWSKEGREAKKIKFFSHSHWTRLTPFKEALIPPDFEGQRGVKIDPSEG